MTAASEKVKLCCARIPFSFEVDRYNEQPANQPFDLYICIVA